MHPCIFIRGCLLVCRSIAWSVRPSISWSVTHFFSSMNFTINHFQTILGLKGTTNTDHHHYRLLFPLLFFLLLFLLLWNHRSATRTHRCPLAGLVSYVIGPKKVLSVMRFFQICSKSYMLPKWLKML